MDDPRDVTPDQSMSGADSAAVVDPSRPSGTNRPRWVKPTMLSAISVLVIGGGTFVGLTLMNGDGGGSPSSSPTASFSPHPSASYPSDTPSRPPRPTATDAPVVELQPFFPDTPAGQVTSFEYLPAAEALPAGIWDETEPGWLLAVYHPVGQEYAGGAFDGPQVLYLVSPTGDLYQVLELDPSLDFELKQWTAGGTTAVVRVSTWTPDGAHYSFGLMDLDLLTGTLVTTSLPLWVEYKYEYVYLGRSIDGNQLWHEIDASLLWEVLPDGTVEEYVIGGDGASGCSATLSPDAERTVISRDRPGTWQPTGESWTSYAWGSGYYYHSLTSFGENGYLATDNDDCAFIAWSDSNTLLFRCKDAFVHDTEYAANTASPIDEHARIVTVTPGQKPGLVGVADAQHVFTAEDPLPNDRGAWVSDGLVAFGGTEGAAGFYGGEYCDSGAYLYDGETFTSLEASTLNPRDNQFGVSSAGGLVYVESSGGCAGEATPATLSVYNPATGETTILVPAPPGAEDFAYGWGLLTWVLGD